MQTVFVKTWDRNLKRQGFIEAARQTGEPQQ